MNRPFQRGSITGYIIIAISLIVLSVLIWQIADVFVIAFGGIVFATALRALALPLARATGFSPRWSLVVVVLSLLAGFGLLAWFFGDQTAGQMAELEQQLPAAAAKFETWLQRSQMGRIVVDAVHHSFADPKLLSNLGLAATAMAKGLVNLLLILFLGVYFAANPSFYREGALRLLPPSCRGQVGKALHEAGEALEKWLMGQAIAVFSVGILAGLSLEFVGVPLAFFLGLLAGLCEFIPVIGPILSAVPGLLLAFSKSPQTAVYALLAYLAVQQLESNLVIPVIQGWAVKLGPAVTLIAVVAFGLLFGIMGVAFATPIAVVVTAMVKYLYVENTLENGAKMTAHQA